MEIAAQIREIVDRETRAWTEKDVETLLDIFHPDMVWPWPPAADVHDPADWIFVLGRYDRQRWGENWRRLFATHSLVHNRRRTVKVVVTPEGDGAFAVVDVDTLWRSGGGEDVHWCGRACKVYTRVGEEWRMIFQTGLLDYARSDGLSTTAAPFLVDD